MLFRAVPRTFGQIFQISAKRVIEHASRKPGVIATLAGVLFLFMAGNAPAQTATVNWTNVHQVIDGFGGAENTGSLSSSDQAFFFGTGSGQLGLSLLRVPVPNNGSLYPGDCTSISTSCAGPYVGDMQAVIANGGRVYASPWSPPAAYKTNASVDCTAGSGEGALIIGDYGVYATWLATFVQSLQQQGINLYAISIQNEPNYCATYDAALWTAGNLDTFTKINLGPTFATDGLSTLIFEPEVNAFYYFASTGGACATDPSCSQYVGGFNWHDYDASLSGTNTVAPDPYPSGWPAKKYWETEASCYSGTSQSLCQPGTNTDITDALNWAAVIDQRIAVDGANAWLYWWLNGDSYDDQGLTITSGNPAQRAYMMGQYSKFVRPGYYRIDATHLPQSGVSVSAYQNTSSKTLAIIATNYTGSAVSQTFNLDNAPAFSSVAPTITSSSQSLATQSSVSVSGNSFTYTLPAQSITTFVGGPASAPAPGANLSNPGFEAGNTSGWSVATNGGSVSIVNNASEAQSGNYFAQLNSNSGEQPVLSAEDASGSTYYSVTPGEIITYGGWVNFVFGNGNASYALAVFDANKASLSYLNTSSVTAGAGWTYVTDTYTVPAGAAYVTFYAQIYQSTEASEAWFDNAVLNTSPTRNLSNPGFETGNTSGWSVTANGGSISIVSNASEAQSGNYFAQLNSNNGEQPVLSAENASGSTYYAVTPGEVITYGGWVNLVSGNGNASYALAVFDANKVNLSYLNTSGVTAGAGWIYVTGTYTVPASAAYVTFYAQIYQSTEASEAWFDNAVFNTSP